MNQLIPFILPISWSYGSSHFFSALSPQLNTLNTSEIPGNYIITIYIADVAPNTIQNIVHLIIP